MRLGVVRPHTYGVAVCACGIVQPSKGLQGVAEIVARVGGFGQPIDGCLIMLQSLFETVLIFEQIGEIVVKAAVIGRQLDGPAVGRFRFRVTAGAGQAPSTLVGEER